MSQRQDERQKGRAAHVICVGELTDAPGRCEQWTETVIYNGRNRWTLVIAGSDFFGLSQEPQLVERMSTRQIIDWATSRDDEDSQSERATRCEAASGAGDQDDADDGESQSGARTMALLDAARAEGADYCIRCLEGYRSGTWPKPRKLRITAIGNVIERGIWFHITRRGVAVKTTRGDGYLVLASDASRMATVYLDSLGTHDRGIQYRLTARQSVEVALRIP